ncbi:fluoride efflux transporter FluC [Paenibacillus mucilaginosus]|uniref:Fluoride-specific ion channel FluC n=3 Tax=Paenibacillus mucilaginosus TaxID=61624 RepID=H6NR19_9BACL|nr:CrcB family protein [Paenibacillus mucilaginosus]AEI42464.1 CrcB protein [Paenibacillus mucilaginosus KNP414]AFC32012.1 CrcB protein [Paenibacillus mucilaginosus 3016]AFH64381.1 chromosome condensation protein CrcB [Paenibacillus mucilaginosus K02]MCG7213863.1 CrcB family protein [Paenibacillus mucilaginosus]WDM25871.1 CrcB family protein [Paenibacillus mucilaginosus]
MMSNVFLALLLVGMGGFAGAVSRYGVSRFAARRFPSWPYGTLFINLTGSFLLGWLAGAQVSKSTLLLLGSGFAGGYTTFSTFKLESDALEQGGRMRAARLYLLLSYALGGCAAYAGYALGSGQ